MDNTAAEVGVPGASAFTIDTSAQGIDISRPAILAITVVALADLNPPCPTIITSSFSATATPYMVEKSL
jgi:hypothetical protein